MRRQHQADRQRAVLLAALDDVAGLDEHRLLAAILDGQLVDVAGLVDPHRVPRHRLLEGQRHGSSARFSVNEVNGEIFTLQRPREAVLALAVRRRGAARDRRREQQYRQAPEWSTMHPRFLHDAVARVWEMSRLPFRESTEWQPKAAKERLNCDILMRGQNAGDAAYSTK